MSKFEVGDLVKGLPESNKYGITNENMTKGVVRKITEGGIVVRVLEHKLGYSGKFEVDPEVFEKIGHLEPFDREKFFELLKESKAKAAEYLSGADLSGADLSGADLSGANLRRANLSGSQGLLDAINFMEAHFERTDEGYIVYKTFGENYSAPESWKIEPGEIIEETVNCDRTTECGCGINVAPIEWVRKYGCNQPYKLLIRWEWLPGVVVSYNTDGKIRCSKAQILEAVK